MQPDSVLKFWFSPRVRPLWFRSTPEFDEEIRASYETLYQSALRGDLESWEASSQGSLALAIVLDQFPLNMYRGTADSFKGEQAAIAVSQRAIDCGFDHQLPKDQLAFLYMPLMHSEDLEHQNLSVTLFEATGLTQNARFAHHHRDLVKRFGRFPHRNTLLGRTSTSEELEYLKSKEAFLG